MNLLQNSGENHHHQNHQKVLLFKRNLVMLTTLEKIELMVLNQDAKIATRYTRQNIETIIKN